ncbi:MAG: dipeptide epimerase [Parvibaculaceae bacterium]|nr:dipeptide epimerase [Parvibaculaceae bacterium]
MIRLKAQAQKWPLAKAFGISRGRKTDAHVVVVEISNGTHTGSGECVPYARYGETIDSVLHAISTVQTAIENGADQQDLLELLPAGAARNAVDCALWDLQAKQTGQPVWRLLDLPEPKPITTAFTLGLDTPEAMKKAAEENAHRPLLKIKLGSEGDSARLAAIREGAPASRLIVDANEGWQADQAISLAADLERFGVDLIEQPLPASDDEALSTLKSPIPFCADESCHTAKDLPRLIPLYQAINIKLDKTGGLTEAVQLARAAKAAGLSIMVGCMVGTSLGMAPALLLASFADYIDLDGPLLLAKDRSPGLIYKGSTLMPYTSDIWG